MSKDTALFGWSYPENGDAPFGPSQIEDLAKDIEARLAEIEKLVGTKATPTEPKPGELVIVNGTSDPQYRAVTGDVTFNSSGVSIIGSGKVLEGMLGSESVATAKIKDLAVSAAKLASDAVETAKILNLAVTTGKLADLAVTAQKLASEAVETGKIKNAAVTAAKMAANSVESAMIKDGAVTAQKIANSAVIESKIEDGAVTSRKAALSIAIKEATGDKTLIEAYADIPGASVTVSPSVEMAMTIWATFHFGSNDTLGLIGQAIGSISLDGAKEDPNQAILFGPKKQSRARATVFQTYSLTLSPGSHTVKMRAKEQTSDDAVCFGENTQMLYMLTAAYSP